MLPSHWLTAARRPDWSEDGGRGAQAHLPRKAPEAAEPTAGRTRAVPAPALLSGRGPLSVSGNPLGVGAVASEIKSEEEEEPLGGASK